MNHKYDCFKNYPGTIPLPAGKKKKKGITGPAEKEIQDFAENYLNALGIKFIHIPDTAYRSNAKTELKGIPDLLCFKPAGKYNSALLMELKRKGAKLRQSQRNWQRMNNVNVILVDSKEQAKIVIDEWRNDD